ETFSSKIEIKDALNSKGTYKMMSVFDVMGSIEKCEDVKNKILDKYGDYVEAYRNQCFIDVVPKGCSKGNGIMMILEDEKLNTDDVYTVGDSFNDVSMFNITKNSYTFNEAEDLVKPHANNLIDYVHEIVE
ncbi:HAD hydrolase family protein, partial [Klebsiella pneumoniae]|nr:HAD hydrolase family protein [Klebsiella pneumoniae]